MAFRQIRIELAEPVPDWELKNELTALKNLDSLQIRVEEEGLFGLWNEQLQFTFVKIWKKHLLQSREIGQEFKISQSNIIHGSR